MNTNTTYNLSGEKLNIKDIVGKLITVKNFRRFKSKIKCANDCMQLQFELDKKLYIVFTSSKVLYEQINKRELPFQTVIKLFNTKDSTYYKFT